MSAYIRYKAKKFLELGPEKYRKADALEKPPQDLEPAHLESMTSLCSQLVLGKGFESDSPLTTNLVPASYSLIDTFHFKVIERRSNYGLASGIFDEFLCRHFVTGQEVTLFVFVDED